MTVLNSIVLVVGGLMMAVPIILHLLMQPKPKPIAFPALRFVMKHERANRRQWRLKNWLLLLLRCLAILAVAAALAQLSVASNAFGAWLTLGGLSVLAALIAASLLAAIFWLRPTSRLLIALLATMLAIVGLVVGALWIRVMREDQPAILGDRSAPVSAVLLVDNAARMSYRIDNETVLTRAKELGSWLIAQFPPESKVGIVTPDEEEPFFSVDLNAAKKRLATLDVVYRDTSIPKAIPASLQLLNEGNLARKELYFVTDLGQASWTTRDDRLQKLLAQHPDVNLYVIDVGVESPSNVQLRPLQIASGSITPAGQLELATVIESTGVTGSRIVRLKLEKPDPTRPVRRDGKTLTPESFWERSQIVELKDSQTEGLEFQLGQLPPGIHHGSVEIEGDDPLPIDNQRFFTIEVRPAWTTLVAHPPDVNPANFVETVSPSRQRESATAAFSCDVIAQAELSSRSLADYRLIALLDPAPITDAVWAEFKKFVEQGGGLFICLGHNASRAGAAASEFNTAAAQQILPGELSEIWRAPEGDVYLSPGDYNHPILSEFRGQASSIRWNRLPVFLHWGLRRSAFDSGEPVEVIMRYSDHRPALVERRIGKGRVVVMTTPITDPPRPTNHPSWNALFFGDEYWASWLLVLQTAQYLVQTGAQSLNFDVDQTVVLADAGKSASPSFWLFPPRDEEPVKLSAESGLIRFRFTKVPGNYRLRATDESLAQVGFSVNMRPDATGLTRIDPQRLDDLLGDGRYRLARGQFEIEREQGVARIGQEFYPVLALVVAALLALEFLMSNLFYRPTGSSKAVRSPVHTPSRSGAKSAPFSEFR